MLQQYRMFQLLLAIVLITICNAQYGDIGSIAASPAPAPVINYAPNIPEENPYINEASNSENEYANTVKQVIQFQTLSPATQLFHSPEHGACIYSVLSTVTQSTIRETSKQPSTTIARSTSTLSRTSKITSTRSRPQSSSTRSSSVRTTRQTTTRPVQFSVTTQRTTLSSRRSTTSRSTQATTRTTRNNTGQRSTKVVTQTNDTRKPEGQTITFDCTLKSYDTLFVVDSTSSVRHFFDDHRNYIAEIITMIVPEIDNEIMIGIIEYSSPLRRQIKLPFKAHKNRSEIISVIKKLPFFAGITATGAALELTLETLRDRRTNALTNVVVLTDGFSYDFVNEPSLMLHRLPNVRTFTATVTNSWRQYELEIIAGDETRVFKGKDSARDLAKALTSCDNNRSRLRNSRRNKLFK
ncbi:Vitrin [Dirofilaria immitis]